MPRLTGHPLRPGRPIYYGWFIVGAAGLVIFCTGPGQSYVFSVFIDSIIEDTNLSRTGISVLYTVSTVVSAALVTFVSRLADRYGPRIMLAAAGLGLGAVCFGMATATNILLFFIVFAGLRALGQGSLSINCILLVNQWFVSRRGRAVGLMTLGAVISTALLPPVVRILIDNVGWRGAYAVLGVAVIALIVPVVLLIVRNRPEDIGLFPDGLSHPPVSETRPETASVPQEYQGVRVRQLLAAGVVAKHTEPRYNGVDLPSDIPLPGKRAECNSCCGSLYHLLRCVSDQLAGHRVRRRPGRPKALLVFSMATLLATLALASVFDSMLLAMVYVVMMGVSGGSYTIVHGTIWAHYYGRIGLGRVQGPAMTISICASAVGPLPLAVFHSLTGTYNLGIMVMMVLPVLSVAVLFFVRPGGQAIRNSSR